MTGFNDNRPRKFRIGILGSYGGLNLGDEAILQVIVAQLRNSLPVEITVFSHNPEDTLSRHGVERALLLLEKLTREDLRPEFERMGLLVLGGGGILFDSYVRPNLRMVELALETGTPVMVYAVGAGPLEDRHEQQIVRDCLNRAAAVTVRAKTSSKLLEEIGVRQRIEVTA
ncbi:MAG: polysaccharide pyruvyl transferase, partial [Nitrospiraceae bacterium]